MLFRSCLNTVRTVFGYIILSFHVFEQCSNSPPCVGVLFEHCSKVFGHHALLCVLFEHCSDSVRTCYTPCPCVQTVFEQPAVRWCAVRTLFEQFVLVWQCLNTSNSVRTTCSCPLPMVSPSFFSFLSPFLFSFYLQPFTSARKRIHARPSATRPHAHPPTRNTSESFLFLSFSFFLFLQSSASARPSARPHAHRPIRLLGTN